MAKFVLPPPFLYLVNQEFLELNVINQYKNSMTHYQKCSISSGKVPWYWGPLGLREGGHISGVEVVYWHIGSRKLRQWSCPCHRIALGSLEHRMRSHSQYRAHILDHLSNLWTRSQDLSSWNYYCLSFLHNSVLVPALLMMWWLQWFAGSHYRLPFSIS